MCRSRSSTTTRRAAGVLALLVMLTVGGCLESQPDDRPTFVDYRATTTTAPPEASLTSSPPSISPDVGGFVSGVSNVSASTSPTSTTTPETRVVDLSEVVPVQPTTEPTFPDEVCLDEGAIKKVLNLRLPGAAPMCQACYAECVRDVKEVMGIKKGYFTGPSRIDIYYSQFNTTFNRSTASASNGSAVNGGNVIIWRPNNGTNGSTTTTTQSG